MSVECNAVRFWCSSLF